jgi:hypothetical protein
VKTLLVVLNLLGGFFGLLAAWRWHQSARPPRPTIDYDIVEIHRSIVEGAALNKRAATMTGLSVLVLAAASIISPLA